MTPQNFNVAVLSCAVLLAAVTLNSHAADATALDYAKDLRPLMEANCFKCHNEKKQKGGVDFSTFSDERSVLKQHKLWRNALEQIETKEMPPEDEGDEE